MDYNKQLEILKDELTEMGYYNLMVVEGRGICGLMRFIFTTAIVEGITANDYKGRWCYPHHLVTECLVAYSIWDGKEDPIGDWIKYKGYGREYCNPKINETKEHEKN